MNTEPKSASEIAYDLSLAFHDSTRSYLAILEALVAYGDQRAEDVRKETRRNLIMRVSLDVMFVLAGIGIYLVIKGILDGK